MNEPKPKKSILKRWWFWAIVIIVLFIMLASGGESDKQEVVSDETSTPEIVEQEEAIEVSARDLYAAYKSNELAAEGQYADHKIRVSGIVKSIGRDIINKAYVSLEGDDIIGVVQCMFDKEEEETIVNLQKGTNVILEGDDISYLGNVILRNCKLKK